MYQNMHIQVSIVYSIVLGGNKMLSKFTLHIEKAPTYFQQSESPLIASLKKFFICIDPR